jgi:hypothetical protein
LDLLELRTKICPMLTAGEEEMNHSGSLSWRGINYFGDFSLRGHGFLYVGMWETFFFFMLCLLLHKLLLFLATWDKVL